MDNGTVHRRMNFYHKKSSRMGRSSSMERPGKFTSSLPKEEIIEGNYKLTDDILYENKTNYKFEEDSNDTILLNKNSINNNIDNYIISSQNLIDALEKSNNYFSQSEDRNSHIINNKKYIYENQKKLKNEIQILSEEYNKEKNKNKELVEKLNQKKLRENMLPSYTNNIPEEIKRKKEYISYLENFNEKLENENKELIVLLNNRNQEFENHNNYNYEEEEYCKFFIQKEISRLKELLSDFNNHNNTHNKYYEHSHLDKNFTKESNQNNEQSNKHLSYYNENEMTNTGGEYNFEDKFENNSNNNTNKSKYNSNKNNLTKKSEFSMSNNIINNNGNKIGNIERNQYLMSKEFVVNSTSHSGMNNKQKTKSKLSYGNLGNKNANKSQRGCSKKKK